ncbi:magnesium and cobalt transport protein CorA [Serinibacter arcticus]|uniref:Magnesium and cobalt transport protein CorA n=1 Tax=Serinibacter arcticus TaxID=1655435 RepID=A0A4Z1E3A3_9MICO|nr:magnesium and cobalt transport protein CorA [Serinibacter arcticus]TGO05639.1 Magnesium and cobalt transport protein CorA [Serinibacter arcticus]
MALIDNGIYVDGVRRLTPTSLDETFEQLHEHDGIAWIGLFQPDGEELASVAAEFSLHPLAVEDAGKGHQRPKVERYGETLFVVLRPAWYIDATETVHFGEIHLFVGPQFVVTVRHAEQPSLSEVRARMERSPELLRLGTDAVLYAVLDQVVDGYGPVIAGLENDIDEIEDQLFAGHESVARRIYELLGEVIAFQRATSPLRGILEALLRGAGKYRTDEELQARYRDVLDHALRIAERADSFRVLLENALTVHSTLATQQQNDAMRELSEASLAQSEETKKLSEQSIAQNEEIKKITSWAAILFAPSLVGTVYGMNFENMPELRADWGYPAALGAMVLLGIGLWAVFRSRKWL